MYDTDFKNQILYGKGLTKSDIEHRKAVCLIDEINATMFFPHQNPIGRKLLIDGQEFTIAGVAKNDEYKEYLSYGYTFNNGNVFVPYTSAYRISGYNGVTKFTVTLDSMDLDVIINSKRIISDYVSDIFPSEVFSNYITDNASNVKGVQEEASQQSSKDAAIAAIALLVGGIGIMNMMLVSVTERTKEIGLRKALGATPARIQELFLIEAIILSICGGVIGVVGGEIISYIYANRSNMEYVVYVSAILVGMGFSAGVGIIFGWVPSRRASTLKPIDALRTD